VGFIEWLHRGALPRELVGGKAGSLSEMLAGGFAVPLGFAVNAEAYRYFERSTPTGERLQALSEGLDFKDFAAVKAFSGQAAELIEATELPEDLSTVIAGAYDELQSLTGAACAVRSSAISEDGAGASFAGLYESYLNVIGIRDVLASVRKCYASLWAERAVRYRALKKGTIHGDAMSVVVMGLVPSEASGIAFTAHPVTGDRDQVVINSSWGLGEAIVSGRVTPDSFVVAKSSLSMLEREIYEKQLAIYPHPDGGGTIERELDGARALEPSISDDQAKFVARLASKIEAHFGCPQDIEWGLAAGQVFLLQSRPITTL
jgi:phosphoenolpyruvate synthase/pyruvate phosphate dikinase